MADVKPLAPLPVHSIARFGLGRGFPVVRGACPACGLRSLFLAYGGHVTCAGVMCPDPGAADRLLHGEATDE